MRVTTPYGYSLFQLDLMAMLAEILFTSANRQPLVWLREGADR